MSGKDEEIVHPGMITGIEPGIVTVKIMSVSACSTCHAKGACTAADMEDKIIQIKTASFSQMSVGQQVSVVMKRTLGIRALMFGYLFPFLVLTTSLIIYTIVLDREGIAGLLALSTLIPYFLILYVFRNRIGKHFVFQLRL
ncbi:MAG: SoxR reducing system RseC family protein [Bacteroidetes bacterium]|nr:SoxR reducing system RseC family protein [Bacteroidota bacterium]MBU1719558.1 SoxR reducing system RseC family protein [Bacteroidota bacterium]